MTTLRCSLLVLATLAISVMPAVADARDDARAPIINVEVLGNNVAVDVVVRPTRTEPSPPPGYSIARDVACLYFLRESLAAAYASWTGECDADGYATGRGRLVYSYANSAPDNHPRYEEGTFEAGKLQGEGLIENQRGQVFKGNFSEYKLNGQGSVWYPNGDQLHGEFSNGIFVGKGMIFDENGYIVYSGTFGTNLKRYDGTIMVGQSHCQDVNRGYYGEVYTCKSR